MKSCNRGIVVALLLLASCDPTGVAPSPDAAETAQAVTCSSGCTVTALPPNGAPESSTFFWTVAGSGVVWNGGAWDVTLPVSAGDVVTQVSIVVRDNGGVTPNRVTARLQAQTASGIVQVGAISSDMSGNTQTLVLSLPTAHVVAVDEHLYVQAVPWTASQQIATLNSMVGNIVVTTEPPSQLNIAQTFNVPLQIFTGFNWSNVLNSTPTTQTYLASAGAGAAYLWIPSQPGRSLTSVALSAEAPSGGSFISIRVMRFFRDDTAADFPGVLIPVPGPGTTWSDIVIPTTPTPSSPGCDIALKLDAQTSGLRVKSIRATWQ